MKIRTRTILTRLSLAFAVLIVVASPLLAQAEGPLWDAITYNDVEKVRNLVSLGANVNQKNGNGSPIILHAVGQGNAEIVELLISKGADVNAKGGFDTVALHYANKKGMAKILLAHGAIVDAPTNYGETPLHWAASAINSLDRQGRVDLVEFTEALIEYGADVNRKAGAGRSYRTPLSYAASSNNLAVAKVLIAHGADVENDSSSPLASIAGDNDEFARLLVEHGARVNAPTPSGQYPLWAAAARGSIKVTNFLLERGADPNATDSARFTALYSAAGSDYNISTVRALLKFGANPNAQSIQGFAALHQAASTHSIQVIELLIANGADVNIEHSSGETPLHRAVKYGGNDTRNATVEALLKKGANPNLEDRREGRTPFHVAIDRGDVELVRLMLGYGVDLTFVYKNGGTYFDFARNRKDIATLLEQRGARATVSVRSDETKSGATSLSRAKAADQQVESAPVQALPVPRSQGAGKAIVVSPMEGAPSTQVYFNAYSADGGPIRADNCGINYSEKGWIGRHFERGVRSEAGITYEAKRPLSATVLFRHSDEKSGKLEIRPEEIRLHVVPGNKLLKPSTIERKPFHPDEKGCDILQYGEWITLKFPIQPEQTEQVALLFPSGTVVKDEPINVRPFRFERVDYSSTDTPKPARSPVSLPDLPPLRDPLFSKELATAMPSEVKGSWVVDAKATEEFFIRSPQPPKADKLAQWLGFASGYMALFTYEFDGNLARARAYRADKVMEFERISDQDTETTYALRGDAGGKQQTLSVSMLKNGNLRIFLSQSLESGYLIWKPGQINADTVPPDDVMAAARTWMESVQRIVNTLKNPSKLPSQDGLKTEAPRKVTDSQIALDQAIQQGAIRKAMGDDINAFRDAYIYKKYTSKNLPVPSTENALSVTRVDLSRAYVVLKEFTYPPGMINENSVVFFIPKGVSEPSGKYGHSAIYHFDTLTLECSFARTGGFSC